MTYLSSADADATATAIEAAAGTVLTGPLDVMDQGRMLVARDPSGAVFGVWQPRSHRGAQLVDEPGSRAWSELVTPDHAAARRFYPSIFAYQTEDMDIGAAEPYVLFKVAGMMAAPPGLPPEAPSSWMTYFAVADTDATVGRVQSSGRGLLFGPQDSEYGRFAVVSDPQGAVLSVIRPPQPAGG